jgi:hypothetical protein
MTYVRGTEVLVIMMPWNLPLLCFQEESEEISILQTAQFTRCQSEPCPVLRPGNKTGDEDTVLDLR